MKKKLYKIPQVGIWVFRTDDLCGQGGGTGDINTNSNQEPQTGGFSVPSRRLYI